MKRLGLAVGVCLLVQGSALAQSKGKPAGKAGNCQQVVFEGDVKAGQEFEQVFASGFRFTLERLPSGWIVRVLATNAARGPHDYAELATPPYKSMSPLLVSTDWAFRSQDAIAWNPRQFRYAGSEAVFRKLNALYDRVMANDPQAMAAAAAVVAEQPEAVLQILDARMVPGLADQGRMASMVAANLSQTPHSVDQAEKPTALGRIEELRFRVTMTLAPGLTPASGVRSEKIACTVPTA